ncbi:hypothetical protein PILCRDRAFT_827200 [Piloderma croceum F 1598]|uniref:Uncharacterized protein n=1 Tax=Piloderma croceum (strain F 1598) TaxID=765440 RepID=A0A0C3F6C6_PILCF|nr:hypothetical protein PILCRDRAFT_827200 [Piloderma croceum F 1598]
MTRTTAFMRPDHHLGKRPSIAGSPSSNSWTSRTVSLEIPMGNKLPCTNAGLGLRYTVIYFTNIDVWLSVYSMTTCSFVTRCLSPQYVMLVALLASFLTAWTWQFLHHGFRPIMHCFFPCLHVHALRLLYLH